MTPEEYERYKEAEKRHLRKLKELKQAVRTLERQKSVTEALELMNRATEEALGTQEELIERLALETARQEARLEVALDSEKERASPDDEQFDEELQRLRARSLVRQMKQHVASDDEDEPGSHEDHRSHGTQDTGSAKADDGHREGRGNPSTTDEPPRQSRKVASQPGPDLPEKTIGRM